MAVTFRQDLAGAAPLLLAEEGSGPAPVVLWFHGFGVDSEVHRPELEMLVDAGFRAVGVDAAGHGRRRLPDLDARIAAPRAESLRTAVELAAETAAEVPAIVRHLVHSGAAEAGRVALAGISMGAYVVYRAVLEEPALRAAVAILGSPEWPHHASPHENVQALGRVPLLSITAELDENVPPAAARRLHQRLDTAAPAAVHRYLELPGGVHLMSAAHWEITRAALVAWLQEHALH